VIAKLLRHFKQFALHNPHHFSFTLQNSFEFFDELLDFLEFVLNLLSFESSELLESHIKNGLRLNRRELKLLHQGCMCRWHILGGTNKLDDLVDMIEGLFETKQDMLSVLCFI